MSPVCTSPSAPPSRVAEMAGCWLGANPNTASADSLVIGCRHPSKFMSRCVFCLLFCSCVAIVNPFQPSDDRCAHGVAQPGAESSIRSVVASATSVAALDTNGQCWTWGQVGTVSWHTMIVPLQALPSDDVRVSPSPIVSFRGRRVLTLTAGRAHFCALVQRKHRVDDGSGVLDK